ncbi:MAG: hypothetical protein AB7T49_13270 [Oligoflexales bacterium]
MKVNENHRAAFAETGVLCLKRAIPKNKTDPAKEYIYEELKRLHLREGGKWQTKKFAGISPFQVAGSIAQRLQHHTCFDEVIPEELVSFLNSLAGLKLRPAQARPQILVTPPQKEEWAVPEIGWHVDLVAPSGNAIPGIQIFVLLDNVAPRGGGTMAIIGSHRHRYVAPEPESVLEMCGSAGDVYLMDMRIRHAPTVNATRNARMMLTIRYMSPS